MCKLALFGGKPVLEKPLADYTSIGEAEIEAVVKVMKTGVISGFYGSWCDEFWGGPVVQAFEKAWAERFGVKHAVSMNSATSGLIAALGAIGIGPGDEVIVPPTTMSATVTAPLVYGAVPVFADIENETFGLDPAAVRRAITPRTKAILAVNLFGHTARLDELSAIAKEHNLILLEDNAQSPLAEDGGRMAGAIGKVGVFSLNYHKHIHTGEGGICVTDDDDLAMRMKMIRNHGENVTTELGADNLANLYGFNFRLTEIQAAIGLEQLRNIDDHVSRSEEAARILTEGIAALKGLTPPEVRPGCRHVYYLWTVRYDENETGVSRETYSRALRAEGALVETGYVEPIYLLPLFQKRVAMGANGFPFVNSPHADYAKGLCPVAERLYEKEIIFFQPCSWSLGPERSAQVAECFRKVHANLDELKDFGEQGRA